MAEAPPLQPAALQTAAFQHACADLDQALHGLTMRLQAIAAAGAGVDGDADALNADIAAAREALHTVSAIAAGSTANPFGKP